MFELACSGCSVMVPVSHGVGDAEPVRNLLFFPSGKMISGAPAVRGLTGWIMSAIAEKLHPRGAWEGTLSEASNCSGSGNVYSFTVQPRTLQVAGIDVPVMWIWGRVMLAIGKPR